MIATIDFSAQFGGGDAATALLPHFKLLKVVSNELSIQNFPFKQMAFILRVDGEINSYHLSGPGNLDFDGENYVSIDLGIEKDAYQTCVAEIEQYIVNGLSASVEFMKNSDDKRLSGIDYSDLEQVISKLIKLYRKALSQ